MQLTGSQRCAVLLLAMGEETAAALLGRMSRREVVRITQAMACLPQVPDSCVRAVLGEAQVFLDERVKGLAADRDLAGRLLIHCLGEHGARQAMVTWADPEDAQPFADLERMRPGQLYQLLRQEHPQTLALILGHLSAPQAAGLLMRLPTDLRSLLLEHIGGLAPVDTDILEAMGSVLARQAAEHAPDWRPGLQIAAEIVAAAGEDAGRELLGALERRHSRLPEVLGRMVRRLEDCLQQDDGLLAEALEEFPGEDLVALLSGCEPALQAALLAHLSSERQESIGRRLRESGAATGQAVACHEHFLRLVRRLQAERWQADWDAGSAAQDGH